jgi:cysteine-rich repeat protein
LSRLPIDAGSAGPYDAPIISLMDHSGLFYSRCCDTRITAFSGATAERGADSVLCPVAPDAPTCLTAPCQCGYGNPDGTDFDVTDGYTGLFSPGYLYYDGHAGYDYDYGFGTPIVAPAPGSLCKAIPDPINGGLGQPTAWDGFHTFYIDHGVFDGTGWSTWYLHAADLAGMGTGGESLPGLAPGECAPVADGQAVATVGNHGTGAPHLHFEVRRYVPGDGPAANTAKVVDAYGWRGAQPDPLADPGENYQAASQPDPLWIACGNGRVECGEQCDDGNARDGDCCSSTCQLDAAATPCTSGRACAVEQCDGAGTCVDVTVPLAGCRTTTDPAKSSLVVSRGGSPASHRVRFKWAKGADTTAADLADPLTVDSYRICIFDESAAPRLVFGAEAPAAGTCAGRSCWKGVGSPAGARGYRYRDKERTPDGLDKLVLKPGADGKASISVAGRGENLKVDESIGATSVRVQIVSDNGGCWEASF